MDSGWPVLIAGALIAFSFLVLAAAILWRGHQAERIAARDRQARLDLSGPTRAAAQAAQQAVQQSIGAIRDDLATRVQEAESHLGVLYDRVEAAEKRLRSMERAAN